MTTFPACFHIYKQLGCVIEKLFHPKKPPENHQNYFNKMSYVGFKISFTYFLFFFFLVQERL